MGLGAVNWGVARVSGLSLIVAGGAAEDATRCRDWQYREGFPVVSLRAQEKTSRSRISLPWGFSGGDRIPSPSCFPGENVLCDPSWGRRGDFFTGGSPAGARPAGGSHRLIERNGHRRTEAGVAQLRDLSEVTPPPLLPPVRVRLLPHAVRQSQGTRRV